MEIREPTITINGTTLHTGQAMTVRVALENFAIDLRTNGLGNDYHGTRMTKAYLTALDELQLLMQQQGSR